MGVERITARTGARKQMPFFEGGGVREVDGRNGDGKGRK